MRSTVFVVATVTLVVAAVADDVSKWDPRMAVEKAVTGADGLKWIDGRYLPLEGKAFADVEHFYDRLPRNVTTNVNAGVRSMKHHTSGMMFRFKTSSPTLSFEWVPYARGLSMDHMPATGMSGIDIYAQGGDGVWRYVKTGRIRSDHAGAWPTGRVEVAISPGTPVTVNLPLYNGVKEIRLGIVSNATVEALGPRKSGVDKPVVFYGTSITHGGCCSRPGLSFVNVIGRDLDVPVVNLGFSGSGVMEMEMSEHLAAIDASCYVLDCLWNMRKTSVAERYEPFIRNLRAKRPDVPIVMAGMCDVYNQPPNDKEKFVDSLYQKLVAEGWEHLVFLPKDNMYLKDFEGTVDGCHPNDWGMMAMAKAYGGAVKEALGTFCDSPESLGVSSKGVMGWLDACEKEVSWLHGFVLLRHGKLVAEGSWGPYDTLNEPHMLFSHSKSFTSTAIGFLVDDGKIDLDERVVDVLADKAPANPSENLRQLRIRDLLTMNLGAKRTDAEGDDINGDWAKALLSNVIDSQPGTCFRYDSGATYLCAAIVERKSGMRLMDFLKARLFDKIGIEKAWSTTSPTGTACGGWGMNMTTRELAKFGQLYLQEGVWNGERILSSEWIALATARQTWSGKVLVANEDGSDWRQGYGFQFWRCRHGCYRADGANGQFTVVMPRQDAVLSIHAGATDLQKVLSLVWERLLPAFAEAPIAEDKPAAVALRRRCAGLTIAPLAGNAAGSERFCGKTYDFTSSRRSFKSIALTAADGGWTAELVTDAGTSRFPIGNGEWKAGVVVVDKGEYDALGSIIGREPLKVASSGCVGPDGVFRVMIRFVTGPHHIELAFGEKDGKPSVTGRLWGIGGGSLTGLARDL